MDNEYTSQTDRYLDRIDILTANNEVDLNKTVYRLCGEDVVCALENMGILHLMTDTEVADAIDIIANRMDIDDWMDNVQNTLEWRMDRVNELQEVAE